MKAFVAYDKSGRVTAVGIPNPELGDQMVMGAIGGDSIITIDFSKIAEGAGQLAFATSGENGDQLQKAVRTIAQQYRVDPASGRLVSKEAPEKGS